MNKTRIKTLFIINVDGLSWHDSDTNWRERFPRSLVALICDFAIAPLPHLGYCFYRAFWLPYSSPYYYCSCYGCDYNCSYSGCKCYSDYGYGYCSGQPLPYHVCLLLLAPWATLLLLLRYNDLLVVRCSWQL